MGYLYGKINLMNRQQLIKNILREGLNLPKRQPVSPFYIYELLANIEANGVHLYPDEPFNAPTDPNVPIDFAYRSHGTLGVFYTGDYNIEWLPELPHYISIYIQGISGPEGEDEFYYETRTNISGYDIDKDTELVLRDLDNLLDKIN